MFIVKKLVFQPCFLLEVIKKGEIMGVNKKFTSAVIVIFVVGFVGSFFIFSAQPLSGDLMDGIGINMFDKSKYLQMIDVCLESQTLGDISLNSFAVKYISDLKQKVEMAETEEEVKNLMDTLYSATNCER